MNATRQPAYLNVFCALLLSIVPLISPAAAQTDTSELASRVKYLEEEIKQLKNEVSILRRVVNDSLNRIQIHRPDPRYAPVDGKLDVRLQQSNVELALRNLPKLLSQARAVPYFRNGKSIGARIFAVRRESLYEEAGLLNGDIIKAIDDKPLTDPAEVLNLFKLPAEQQKRQILLERGGTELTLIIHFDNDNADPKKEQPGKEQTGKEQPRGEH